MTTPSSTSQSVFSLLRGIRTVVVGPDDGDSAFMNMTGSGGIAMPDSLAVVGVVEPDAHDLAWAPDRRADACPGIDFGQGVSRTVHDRAQPVESAPGEERAVVVSDVVGDVAGGAVDEHRWALRFCRPDAQQPHEAGPTMASASISTSNPGGSPT